MDRQSVDVIVIGSGQGGTSLAAKLAKRGRRVSLFERSHLGGACVNEGCTPSKTLLASAHAVGAVRRAAKLGVDCGPSASAPVADFERVMRRVREVRHAWREGVETVDEVENLEVVPADATFAGPHVVRGDGVERGAERIVINTGRSARAPEIPGLGEAPIHTTESIFELEHRPRRLGVLGAGYVGLELGQAFARLGCEVVLTDRGTRVLHHEAADVSESLEAALREDGVRLRLGVRVDRVEAIDGGAACVLHFNDGSRQQVDALLLAAGRAPNTGSLAVDRAGVELDERGYVKVNDRFETTAEGVYAIGSVAGQAPFTHSSSEDGRRLLAIWDWQGSRSGRSRATGDRTLSYAVFTDPSVGRVGHDARSAREAGLEATVHRTELKDTARGREWGLESGYFELVAETATGRLLGGTFVGHEASELVQMLIPLVERGESVETIGESVFIHPTFGESIMMLARKFAG